VRWTMSDVRFDTPIFTIAETHRHLAIPASTVSRWMGTKVAGKPLVHRLAASSPQAPSVPFVGVVEAFVLRLLRDRGMSLRDLSTAVLKVRDRIGSEYALASRRITTDGIDVFIDVSQRSHAREWVRARDDQAAFREVVEDYLLNIEFGTDDIARRLKLPSYEGADVIVDPRFGLGQPVLAQQKVRVQDLVDAWWGGDRLEEVAREYRIPLPEAEAAIRAATRHAA
jgi:uncharacterized protein (DUF433 family)